MRWLGYLDGLLTLLVGISLIIWGSAGRRVPLLRDRPPRSFPPWACLLLGIGSVLLGLFMLAMTDWAQQQPARLSQLN